MKVAQERGPLGPVPRYDEPIANPNGDGVSGFAHAVIGEKAAIIILNDGIQAAVQRSDLTGYKLALVSSAET
jgi:hypothetical protein